MCWLNKCGHRDWQKLYMTKGWWIAHFRVCRPIFLISSVCWSMWQICKINWIAISFFFLFFFCLINLIIIFSTFLRIISNSYKIEFKKKRKRKSFSLIVLKMQLRKNAVMIKMQLRKNAVVIKTTESTRRKESWTTEFTRRKESWKQNDSTWLKVIGTWDSKHVRIISKCTAVILRVSWLRVS